MRKWTRLDRLYLDFDTPHCTPIDHLCYTLRLCEITPLWFSYRRSASGKGWHVEIAIDRRILPAEIVAIQACMGSDLRRERLNLMRSMAIRRHGASSFWRFRWNILYDRKKIRPVKTRAHGRGKTRNSRNKAADQTEVS